MASKILELQNILREKDHFDVIAELATKLITAGFSIRDFNESIKDLKYKRAKFVPLIVYASVLVELSRTKLSIMGNEWNEENDRVLDILLEEFRPSFDDVEF